MDKRIGVIAIVVEDRENSIAQVNQIISSYSHIVIGRMGIPYREKNISTIALIVEGTTDEIGALSGKLGSVKGINVKSALTKF